MFISRYESISDRKGSYIICLKLYQIARAAIRKYQKLNGFNNRNVFFQSSGLWLSTVKVSAGWFLLRLLSLACRWPDRLCAVSSCNLFPCAGASLVSLCVPNFHLLKGHLIGLGPMHVTSFNLNHPFKSPVSSYSHILRYWGLEFQHLNFGRTQFSA